MHPASQAFDVSQPFLPSFLKSNHPTSAAKEIRILELLTQDICFAVSGPDKESDLQTEMNRREVWDRKYEKLENTTLNSWERRERKREGRKEEKARKKWDKYFQKRERKGAQLVDRLS